MSVNRGSMLPNISKAMRTTGTHMYIYIYMHKFSRVADRLLGCEGWALLNMVSKVATLAYAGVRWKELGKWHTLKSLNIKMALRHAHENKNI